MSADLLTGGVLAGALVVAYCVACDAVHALIQRWRGER
jgi:hypothetical protein